MPNRDKTGPNGDGTKTGKQKGNCDTQEKGRGQGKGQGRK